MAAVWRNHGLGLAASLLWAFTPPVLAGTVTVQIGRDDRTIEVVAVEATVEDILTRLRAVKPFEVENAGSISAASLINIQMIGPASSVIEQVLGADNFLLFTNVRTREVERVVILGPRLRSDDGEDSPSAKPEVTPAPVTTSPAAIAVPAAPAASPPDESLAVARPPEDWDAVMSSRHSSRRLLGGSSGGLRQRRGT